MLFAVLATNGRSPKYSGGQSPTRDDYEPVRNLPDTNGHSRQSGQSGGGGGGHNQIPAGRSNLRGLKLLLWHNTFYSLLIQ